MNDGAFRAGFAAAAAICAMTAAVPASAQERSFDVRSQPASTGIPEFARQADIQILASEAAVRAKKINAVKGRMTIEDGLRRLLQGTDIHVVANDGRVITLAADDASPIPVSQSDQPAGEGGGILVTGSRIRGAPSAAPVTVRTQEQARAAGESSMADIIRHIPQNFGGGTNLGVAENVPETRGNTLGGGNSINLRGLGSDATLTLLNGHRLAYGADAQGVDVSSIPLLALDRIEIVTDGSSALYGSDAVAGVANIILKRGYEGVAVDAHLSASTDGGAVTQQYGVIGGHKWASGEFMAAAEYRHATPILGKDRSYSADTAPNTTLFPGNDATNLVMSGQQELIEGVEVTLDANYSHQKYKYYQPYSYPGTYLDDGAGVFGRTKKYAISPSVKVWLGDWTAELVGMYAKNTTRYGSDGFFQGSDDYVIRGCYCNSADSVELGAEGPLFSLPGGAARAALGGGYRSNRLLRQSTVNGDYDELGGKQEAKFLYGEIDLPIVGPGQGLSWLYRLNVSGAVRYEKYREYSAVTPKFSVVASPNKSFDLKATWGKSFKAPTLYQQFNPVTAALDYTDYYGGGGFPANATVLYLAGGSTNLKPERSNNWTATLSLHPEWLADTNIDVTAFGVHFKDRVVTPILYDSQALSDPAYSSFIHLSPSQAELDAVLQATRGIAFNYTGADYDPLETAAIINNSVINAGSQEIRGVDISADHTVSLGSHGSIKLSGAATYMTFKQRIQPNVPEQVISGFIFGPPNWRGQAGATWVRDKLSLSSFFNYIGSVHDTNSPSMAKVKSMQTLDVTFLYSIMGKGLFSGLDVGLSFQNILNDKPGRIETNYPSAPYDSTNYNPFGRVIAFNLTKKL